MKKLVSRPVFVPLFMVLCVGLPVGVLSAAGEKEERMRKQVDAKFDRDVAEAVKRTSDPCYQFVEFVFPGLGSSKMPAVVLMGQVIRPGDQRLFHVHGTDGDVVLEVNGSFAARRSNTALCASH
jgi:hypothetical protein